MAPPQRPPVAPEPGRGRIDAGLPADKDAAADQPDRAPFAAEGPDMAITRGLMLTVVALALLALGGIAAGWISVAAI